MDLPRMPCERERERETRPVRDRWVVACHLAGESGVVGGAIIMGGACDEARAAARPKGPIDDGQLQKPLRQVLNALLGHTTLCGAVCRPYMATH